MTVAEKINNVLKNHSNDTDTDKLILAAYYKGREDVAKEICDKAREIFAAQIDRAAKVRYHHLAIAVQGNIDMIYHPDYAGDYYYGCLAGDEINSAELATQQNYH